MAKKTEQDKTDSGVRALAAIWATVFVVVIIIGSGMPGRIFGIIGQAWAILAEASGPLLPLVVVAAGWATGFVALAFILAGFSLAVEKWRATRNAQDK